MEEHTFERATQKLEDARLAVEKLRSAGDAQAIREAFHAFLAHARAITQAIQKDGRHVDGFDAWWTARAAEMRADPLLRFVWDSRNDALKAGGSPIRIDVPVTYLGELSIEISDELAQEIGAGPYQFAFDSTEGAYLIIHGGTPRERRVPVQMRGDHDAGQPVAHLVNGPQEHLGAAVADPTPLRVAELALAYYERLVFETRQRFEARRRR